MEQENKAILNLEDLKKNYLLSFKGKVYVFFPAELDFVAVSCLLLEWDERIGIFF